MIRLPSRSTLSDTRFPYTSVFRSRGRIGIGVEEDVAMIERRLEPDRLRQQHAVAENVARHVAATDDRDRLCLHDDAAFGEMTLDRNPPAARGDRKSTRLNSSH